jgi:hypothetical protein
MTTQMHFRTDGQYYAEVRRAVANPQLDESGRFADMFNTIMSEEDRAAVLATPLPEPGDIWRIEWHSGGFAGYAICCPKCGAVHHWTSANNCEQGPKCEHCHCTHVCSDKGQLGSCWTWAGSAEENTLSAHPSLHASGACGWHGYLTDGELKEC